MEPMSDVENDENCDTSNITKTSDHDEEDLSEYEKLRLKNIAERKAKFNELKIKDKVLDLSRNNKIKKTKVTKEKLAAVKRPILARDSKAKKGKFKCDQCSKTCKSKTALEFHLTSDHVAEKISRKFRCKHCRYTSFNRSYIKIHTERRHSI